MPNYQFAKASPWNVTVTLHGDNTHAWREFGYEIKYREINGCRSYLISERSIADSYLVVEMQCF